MILTITIILSVLVAFNFLLLQISCNKITKRERPNQNVEIVKDTPTIQPASNHLAPTGS